MVTLFDTRMIKDVLSADRYELRFGLIPNVGNDRGMTIKCQRVSLPQFGNEAFEVALNGHVNKFRGKRTYEHTFEATFVETAGMESLKVLQKWHEFVVGTNSGNSIGYKVSYAIERVEIIVYDTFGLPASKHQLYGVFPQTVNSIDLDSGQSQAVLVNATFSFDFMDSNLKPTL